MTLNAKIGVFTDFFHDMRLRKSLSFTRRRHCRQRHTRLWLMCIRVPMGRVQVICNFWNYNYWTGNAIGFRASRELCSNFLFFVALLLLMQKYVVCFSSWRTASAKQLIEHIHRSNPHFRRYVQQVDVRFVLHREWHWLLKSVPASVIQCFQWLLADGVETLGGLYTSVHIH